MRPVALPCLLARTEDTALLKSNRSAVPGAETEERAVGPHAAARPSPALVLRDRPPCEKLSRQDAATRLTGCPSPLANLRWSQFQFTVNQDTSVRATRLRVMIALHQFPPSGVERRYRPFPSATTTGCLPSRLVRKPVRRFQEIVLC